MIWLSDGADRKEGNSCDKFLNSLVSQLAQNWIRYFLKQRHQNQERMSLDIAQEQIERIQMEFFKTCQIRYSLNREEISRGGSLTKGQLATWANTLGLQSFRNNKL